MAVDTGRITLLGVKLVFFFLTIFLGRQTTDALTSYTNVTDVIQFDSYDDFKRQVLGGDEIWAIQLYREDDCRACDMLAPTWKDLARVVKGIFKVAVMDATTPQGNQFAATYGLDTLPSYIILADDKNKPYARDPEKILEEMLLAASKTITSRSEQVLGTGDERKIHDSFSRKGRKKLYESNMQPKFSSTNIEADASNYDDIVMKSEDVVVVAFVKPNCKFSRKLKRQFEETGSRLVGESAKAVWVNLEFAPDLVTIYNIQSTPTIMIFPGGQKSHEKAYKYTGDRVGNEIAAVVLKEIDKTGKKKQVEQVLGMQSLESNCRGYNHVCVIGVLPHISETGAHGRNKYIELLTRMQTIFRGSTYSFLWVEAGAQPSMEDAMKLDFGFPALVTFTLDRTAFSVFKGSFSDKGISTYLHSVASGATSNQVLPYMFPVMDTEAWDGKDAPSETYEDIPLSEIMDDIELQNGAESDNIRTVPKDDVDGNLDDDPEADEIDDLYFKDEL
ncbi:protein disulfide-isomerase A6 [Fistulifera solaris]|uniref:Protein disulfide-isomerase A6 n=1 Tax=Fistulifera solaris TaxID=1519565 RepID=A0A1Z5JSX0_FISSO|nr:protein disulfide-isomerase A6 [Fistulifera solaris]|eukprot:GAX16952.1 protein disulfide-isomerase A6 [Fistulifera solaris]